MTEKTIAHKLQIKEGYAIRLVGALGSESLLGELPSDARMVADSSLADAALLFVSNHAALDRQLAETLPGLTNANAVWLCYPKGNKTDINRDTIRERAAQAGWEIVSNVSIDDVWSALRAKPGR